MTSIRPVQAEAPEFIERDFRRVAANIKERQTKPPLVSKVIFIASSYFRMTDRHEFMTGYVAALQSIYGQTDNLLGISPWSIKLKQATPTLYYLELEAAVP